MSNVEVGCFVDKLQCFRNRVAKLKQGVAHNLISSSSAFGAIT